MEEGLVINNKLRIKKMLGEGGMGAVYEAENIKFGARIAIKQLKEKFAGRKDLQKRFKDEGRVMFDLIHPHIVRVHDYDLEDGFGAYLVMDLVEGPNLGQLIKDQGPLGLDEVVRIGSEVASALAYAYSRFGLVHRDIKPGNILIENTTGRAIVTDFGIAKRTQRQDNDPTFDPTGPGDFIGTTRYSSPEQLRSEELDQRADIYSLGAVLYEMASGHKLLEDMPENQIFLRVGGFQDWKPDLPYPETVPPALRELIEACLERDRDKRIADASEVAERLRQCREGGRQPTSIPPPRPPKPRPAPGDQTQTITDEFRDLRKQLRQDVDAVLQRVSELDRIAAALGVQTVSSEQTTVVRSRLDAVADVEERGDYQDAVQELGKISELASAQQEAVQQRLRDAIDGAHAELAGAWQDLAGRAAGLVSDTQLDRFQQMLAYVVESARSDDWERASVSLGEARQVHSEAEANARQLAEREAQASIASIRESAAQLERANALPTDFDRGAVEAQIEAALAEGRYAQARTEAAAAVKLLEAEQETLKQRARDRAGSARHAVTEFLRGVDFENVPAPAAEIVRRAEKQVRTADAALRRDDYAKAADAYGAALETYREADKRRREDDITAQIQALRDILVRLEQLRERGRESGIEYAETDLAPVRRTLQELEDGRNSLAPAAAKAQLAAASARVDEIRDQEEAAIRAALTSEIERLAESWEAFTERAGRFATEERRQGMVGTIDAARRQLPDEALESSLRTPADLRERMAQAEQAATAAARAEVEQSLRRAQELHAEIAALDPATVPASVDLDQLQRDVERQLEDRDIAAADQQVSAALNKLTEALAELRRLDAEKAEAARVSLETVVAKIDLVSAARAAGAQVEAATVARERGDAAFAEGDHRAAAAAYAEAQSAYQEAAQRLEVARAAAVAGLQAAIKRTHGQPDDVVGEALRGAEALLAGGGRLEALEQKVADIDAALAQVDTYKAALAAQQRCVSAESRVLRRSQVALSRWSIRRRVKSAKALRQEAEVALEQHSWSPAADGFAAAAEAWTQLDPVVERIEKQPPRSPWPMVGGGVASLIAVALAIWVLTQPDEKKPQPPKPVPFEITSPQPSTADVALKEGEAKKFSVAVAGGAPGAVANVLWTLDGKPLDVKGKEWSYAPDFKAARAQPHVVRAQVGEGDDTSSKQWNVSVEDVNRRPVVAKAGEPGQMAEGESVTLRANATDEDEDPLRYAWTVDGSPAGKDEPKLDMKVTGKHKIALAVTDGKVAEPVTIGWDIAVLAPLPLPPLKIAFEPASISSLRFSKAQEFRLSPPADAKGLKYDWRLNGSKVQGSSSYLFANADMALLGKSVNLAVIVVDDRNREFTQSWAFKVVSPPPPRIAGSKPSSPIDAKLGSPVDLSLTPPQTVNGQTVTYSFSVDGGSEQKVTEPKFRFTPKKEEHSVVARAVDNFGQSSGRVTWRIRVPPGRQPPADTAPADTASVPPAVIPPAVPAPAGTAAVEAWLENYRKAFMQRDINALQGMMKLNSSKAKTLEVELKKRKNLQVAFSNVNVEPLPGSRFRATYTRKETYTMPNGDSVSPPPWQVQQEFRSVDGSIQLEK